MILDSRRRCASKRLGDTQKAKELFGAGYVYEYSDSIGNSWYDVNPVIGDRNFFSRWDPSQNDSHFSI